MTQPEALRLADKLSLLKFSVVGAENALAMEEAAAELRRLVAQRDALLEALLWIDKRCPGVLMDMPFYIHREMAHDAGACACAAIKAAEENT